METFDFPMHLYEISYVENQARAQLGGNWQWVAAPDIPEQRIIKLSFVAMRWIFSGDTVDRVSEPQINIAKLEDFYKAHLLHEPFIYPSTYHGDLTVRFNKPFILPKGLKGGNGSTQGLELEFIEVPSSVVPEPSWILAAGAWDDGGVWDDSDVWKDSV